MNPKSGSNAGVQLRVDSREEMSKTRRCEWKRGLILEDESPVSG